MATVWISDWELECCGDAVSVGDYVQWPVQAVSHSDWLERLFAGTPVIVGYRYAVHDPDETVDVVPLNATIEKIETVTSKMIATPVDEWATSFDIADGTSTRDSVSRADRRRTVEDTDDVHFVGYLVTVDG